MEPTSSKSFKWTDASPASSTQDSYFSSSSADNSKGSTPASTPGARSEEKDSLDICKTGANPLPPLLREFPKPADEVDVQSLLGRQPGRWTLHGQIAANSRRVKFEINDDDIKEKRAQEFEKAKRDLLASHTKFQS
jgi:hypothetical protein